MTGRLAERTAIVVGAGQTPGETIGNGKAIATLFGREGADLLCVDLDEARAEETAAEIVAAGGQASAMQADVTRSDDAARIVAVARERLGRIDVLVNNVGIGMLGAGDGPAEQLSESAFDRTIAVNVKGMWLTIRAALPVMREGGGGAIVNISSLEAVGGDSLLAYELSKAAVNRLTTAVASSHATQGIRCNAVMPGLMDTPLAIGAVSQVTGMSAEAARSALGARVPLRSEMGTAWDTAKAALFLASEDARYITGVLLPVDGGMAARVG